MYLTTSDKIIPITRGFQREKLAEAARGQDRIATAAAIVCITAVFDRTTVRYGARGRGYVYMEAGHAAQNLILKAVDLGLGTTMVGHSTMRQSRASCTSTRTRCLSVCCR